MKKADKNLLSGSTTLLVLSLLSSGDKYGYEMIAELEARSDHTFTLKEGTLYPILHTLEKDGAVKSYEKEAPTGRMRKYYRITRQGPAPAGRKEGGVGGIYPYCQRHSGRNQSGPGMSAPAAAPHRTISQFCDHVCMYIRFRPDHEAITAELTAHLEDHKDAILEIHPDMTLWEAERRAVEAMGNPEELGRWLDSIHNPLLGWLQIWFVRAVCILAALVLVLALPQAERVHNQAADIQRLRSWGPSDRGHVTADFAPDGTWTWRGYTFSIPRAVVEQWEEGQKVSYLLRIAHPNPWQQHPWLREGVWAEDDLGNRYYSMEEHQALSDQGAFRVYMGRSSGNYAAAYPFATYYDMGVSNIDPAATEITLHFDRYGEDVLWLTIPLEGGGLYG